MLSTCIRKKPWLCVSLHFYTWNKNRRDLGLRLHVENCLIYHWAMDFGLLHTLECIEIFSIRSQIELKKMFLGKVFTMFWIRIIITSITSDIESAKITIYFKLFSLTFFCVVHFNYVVQCILISPIIPPLSQFKYAYCADDGKIWETGERKQPAQRGKK